MQNKAELAVKLNDLIEQRGLSQTEAAGTRCRNYGGGLTGSS